MRISIVGGAALSLGYYEREATIDVDAMLHPSAAVRAVTASLAAERGLASNRLNADAAAFLPPGSEEWEVIHEQSGVLVELAGAGMLLAMKLNAARPGRDERDIEVLLGILGIESVLEAEEHFERFDPGEALRERAVTLLEDILRGGPPTPPPPPPPIVW